MNTLIKYRQEEVRGLQNGPRKPYDPYSCDTYSTKGVVDHRRLIGLDWLLKYDAWLHGLA